MKIPENPVVYVTKDRERGAGIAESDTYSIVAGDGNLDTLELLSRKETQEIIEKNDASVLVFKNTKQIEELARTNGWNLLNPSAELAEKIENKITQVAWLGDAAKLLPPHRISLVKKIVRETDSNETTSIVQWAHSHTGEGTLHIKKDSDLKIIKDTFPDREARVTTFIKGPMFTVNIVVNSSTILMGNVSYQITGLPPFTDFPFSTIGNDWSLPFTILSEAHLEAFEKIVEEIGTKFQSEGWKGLFGIDVVYDEERDKLFLIEINARQPASTTYESQLQEKARASGVPGLTLFEAHLLALTDKSISLPLIIINDGAQIIQRVTKTTRNISTKKLTDAGYHVITYPNTKINNDLVRIQSLRGIMETHTKFNTRGKEIVELLS